jgi:hypothetical protein
MGSKGQAGPRPSASPGGKGSCGSTDDLHYINIIEIGYGGDVTPEENEALPLAGDSGQIVDTPQACGNGMALRVAASREVRALHVLCLPLHTDRGWTDSDKALGAPPSANAWADLTILR